MNTKNSIENLLTLDEESSEYPHRAQYPTLQILVPRGVNAVEIFKHISFGFIGRVDYDSVDYCLNEADNLEMLQSFVQTQGMQSRIVGSWWWLKAKV